MALRRWIRWVLIAPALVLGLLVVAVALLQTSPVATWVVRRLLGLVPLNPGYVLKVDRVSGNWLTRLQLEGVRLLHGGRELARVDRVGAAYSIGQLRGAETRISAIDVEGVRATARRGPDGWDVMNAFRHDADTTQPSETRPIAIGRLTLDDVQLAAELGRDTTILVRDLTLQMRDFMMGDVAVGTIDTIGGRVAPPAAERGAVPRWLAFAGRGAATPTELRVDPLRLASDRSRIVGALVLPRRWSDARLVDRLAIRLDAEPLALADVASWVPGVRSEGELQLAFRASARNRVATGRLTGRLGEAALVLDGSTALDSGTPSAIRVHGTVRALDPSRVYASAPPGGRYNGELDADLRGNPLRQASGRVALQLENTRAAPTALRRATLQADLAAGRADLALRAAVGQGSVTASGWARPFDSVPSYDLRGEARRLPGTDSLARQLAGPDGDPVLVARFRAAGRGLALDSASATGRVDLIAVRRNGDRVPLGHAPFTLAERRIELRPELLLGGGRITALASARLDTPLRYELRRGVIDRVDLGRLSGDTVPAPLSGRFSGQGQGTAPAEAVATFRVELDTLRYGARRVDSVVMIARLDRGRARLELGGALQGGRVALDLDARPFDSTRTFVVRRAALDRVDVGTFLGKPNLAGPVTLGLSGRGRQRGTARDFEGRLDIRPSKLGQVEIHGGTATASLHGDRATYDASIVTNGGAIAASGAASGLGTSPAVTVRDGRFDSLNLATLLGRPRLASRLNGRFTASLQGQGLDSLRAEIAVDVAPSVVGDDTLRSGRLAVAVDRGAIRADLITESSAGDLLAQAVLQAKTDSAGLVSLAGTIGASGGIRDVRVDTLHVVLQPVVGAIDVDTIVFRSNVAELDGGGRVALRADLVSPAAPASTPASVPTGAPASASASDTLRLAGFARNLAPLTALLGLDTVVVDSARLSLAVTGPAHHWQVAGETDIRRLLYAGKQAERLVLRANASLDSSGVAGLAGDLRVEGGAVGRMRINELAATARYDSVVALQATAVLGDSVRFVTAVQGTVTGDTIRATLQRLDLAEGGRRWSLERPTPLLLRPHVEIDRLALRSAGRSVLVNGTFDRTGTSDLTLQIDSLDLDVFRELGLAPIPGQLDGRLHLAGTAAKPTLDGRFGLAVRRGGRALGQLAADLSWTGAGLRLDAVVTPTRGGRLTANGTLPWQLTFADTAANAGVMRRVADTLGFVVRADSFDLAFFDPFLPPENAKALRGTLHLDTRIAGTVEQPRVDGRVQLAGMGVELPPLGLAYRDGEVAGEFGGDELRLTRVVLRTDEKEELVAQGTVRFRPLTDPALDLTATLRDFRISNSPTLHTIASGRLALKGTAAKPSLTGALRLGRTEVFQGAEGKATAAKPVELTPEDLQELAQHFGPAAAAEAKKGPGLVERFQLNIDVRLPRDVWFRRRVSPRADIELSGRLRLKQEPGREMQFFGTVEPTPRRGFLDVYGRSFSLTGGEITLAGPVDSMKLDVTAEYQVPTQAGPDAGIFITVAAKGRADSLSLAFTADPSLDQEDIISYIVTGRPSSENPLAQEGGSPEETGAQLAFGALSERLAGAAGSKLGLDVFQIKQDGLRGLTLTAGRYVAPRVFLSLQQPIQLSTSAQQTPGANYGPGFEVEYAARRWLRANLRGGSLPARFFLRGRHAY